MSASIKGTLAGRAGLPKESNPYSTNSKSWFGWNMGWERAHEKFKGIPTPRQAKLRTKIGEKV